MGMSSYGILFYGIPYDKSELPENYYDSFDEYVREKQEREIPFPTTNTDTYRGPEWDEWREKRKIWDKKQVDLNFAGHYDCAETVYLTVNESEKRTEWDKMIKVTEDDLHDIKLEWVSALKKVCEDLGFPFKQPAWYLTSYYG